MYITLGGTGNVGSSEAETLLEKGEAVTVRRSNLFFMKRNRTDSLENEE